MNSPLVYLTLTRFKNKLLSILKKPSYVILAVIIIALLGFTVVATEMTTGDVALAYRDFSELYAIIMAVFAFVFVTTAFNGISKGASMFSMADVNLMFTSPIKSAMVLLYGLVQQMGTSLLLGFFILFQFSWANTNYGVDYLFLLVVFLGYALSAFCGQLTAMVIYILTSSSDKKRTAAKYSVIAICVCFAGYLIYSAYLSDGSLSLSSLAEAATTVPISLFPIAGWLRTSLLGTYAFEPLSLIILTASLTVIYIVAMFLLVVFIQKDYYEDVLKATEVSFSAINARKEGKQAEPVPSNIKVGKIGLGKGFGSETIFYKHQKENSRSKVFLFDIPTMVYMAIAVIFSLFMREFGLVAILVFTTYLQVFSVSLGRWTKEFAFPYIYMIPESNFKKLICCLKESMIRFFVEAVITFALIGVIAEFDITVTLICILIRFTFALLFTNANLFVTRFFGGISIKGMVVFLYLIFSIMFTLPGIAGAMTFYFFTSNLEIALTVLTLVNVGVSLVLLFASRNILKYSELNNQ